MAEDKIARGFAKLWPARVLVNTKQVQFPALTLFKAAENSSCTPSSSSNASKIASKSSPNIKKVRPHVALIAGMAPGSCNFVSLKKEIIKKQGVGV